MQANASNEQFYCGLKPSGQLHFGVKISSNCIAGAGWQTVTSSNTLNINQWYHITFKYDEDKLQIYLDGSLISENDIINDGPIDQCLGGELKIGKNWDSDPDYISGKMDAVQFWNTALSASEIQKYMSCPPNGLEANLVGLWNFEEGLGNTVFDQTVNGNNGTINGATFNTDAVIKYCPLLNTSI